MNISCSSVKVQRRSSSGHPRRSRLSLDLCVAIQSPPLLDFSLPLFIQLHGSQQETVSNIRQLSE